ncbi:MAG: hypothetical protein ACYTDW_17055 [Planctomycetota bacterium]
MAFGIFTLVESALQIAAKRTLGQLGKTNPIQTQYKPNQTQLKPIKRQNKPNSNPNKPNFRAKEGEIVDGNCGFFVSCFGSGADVLYILIG